MKRDMDLIRKILLAVEESEGVATNLQIEGYNNDVVRHHIWLLGTADMLLTGDVYDKDFRVLPQGTAICLKWAGAEFLDAARNESVWNDAKERVAKTVGTVSVAVVVKVLAEIAIKKLGLSP